MQYCIVIKANEKSFVQNKSESCVFIIVIGCGVIRTTIHLFFTKTETNIMWPNFINEAFPPRETWMKNESINVSKKKFMPCYSSLHFVIWILKDITYQLCVELER